MRENPKMGYVWLVPGRIAYVLVTGHENAAEFHQIMAWALYELETNARPPYAHFIVDIGQVKAELSILDARRLSAPVYEHPNTGWIIQINPNMSLVMNMLTSTMAQLAKTRTRNLKSLSEALEFLCDVDATLPPLASIEIIQPELQALSIWQTPVKG